MENNTAKRGFASMDPERQKAIARKGGLTHSKEHMARIGKAGGLKEKKQREPSDKPRINLGGEAVSF